MSCRSPANILFDVNGDEVTVSKDISNVNRLHTETKFTKTAVDAFGRLRISNPQTLFDSKQIFDNQPLHFVTSTSGSGSVTYNTNTSSSILAVSTASGDVAIRQTKRYFNYQSGKSMLIYATFNFNGGVTNNIKRVGYFDDSNGIFLQLSSGALSFVRRTSTSGSPVDNVINRADWNLDKLDGTGPSQITLDLTKAQLLIIDLEWLGIGGARIGFVINDEIIYAHQMNHGNILSEVYIRTPNLPVRWEIRNTGTLSGSTNLNAICCTIISEGGLHFNGIIRAADRGTTAITTNNVLRPLISIRLKSQFNRAFIFPTNISVLATTNNANFYWQLAINPTVTGGTAASWTSITNSYVEYDIAQTGTISGGIVLASGYTSANLSSLSNFIELAMFTAVAADFAGTSDILVLSVSSLTVLSESYYGGVAWAEL